MFKTMYYREQITILSFSGLTDVVRIKFIRADRTSIYTL